jgi:hypothetical protein
MLKLILPLAAILSLGLATAAPAAQRTPAEKLFQRECANSLNTLRIVRPSRLAAVTGASNVVLHQICRGVRMTTFGNAGGLRHTIAANPVLARALGRHGFSADEVVGVEFGAGDSVHLYVHHQV